VERLKRSSSKWLKTRGDQFSNFFWQQGYAVFSVDTYEIDRLVRYIDEQDVHHRQRDFKYELLAFLENLGVEYDERYLWD
jgi:hypothetical protein